jgi:hypothetical protein
MGLYYWSDVPIKKGSFVLFKPDHNVATEQLGVDRGYEARQLPLPLSRSRLAFALLRLFRAGVDLAVSVRQAPDHLDRRRQIRRQGGGGQTQEQEPADAWELLPHPALPDRTGSCTGGGTIEEAFRAFPAAEMSERTTTFGAPENAGEPNDREHLIAS